MAGTQDDGATGTATPEPAREPAPGGRGFALTGIFIILSIYALYFGREFFMPVVLAFLFALTLTPIVRFLRKRGVPSALSATLLVIVSAVTLTGIGYMMSGPVMELVADAPNIGRELRERLAEIRRPLDRVLKASEQLDQ